MDSPSESIKEQSQMPVYAAYTPNLLPSTFYVDTTDTWRAHPSMWANDDVDMEDFTPAFTENPGLVKSTAATVPFNEKEFSAEEGDYMVPSDAHRLNEAATKINDMVSDATGGDMAMNYPEWWKSKLTVTATEADQLADFLSYVNSLNSVWEGFGAEYGTDPEYTEEGFPILIEDIAFPGLSYSYFELRESSNGDGAEEVVYILNPFTADRESLEEINAALDTGYLELYKVIPVSELSKFYAESFSSKLARYGDGKRVIHKKNKNKGVLKVIERKVIWGEGDNKIDMGIRTYYEVYYDKGHKGPHYSTDNFTTLIRNFTPLDDEKGSEEKKNCGCGQDPCVTYGAESPTFHADYSPGQIITKKLNLIPPSDLTGGKFLGMGTCLSCNTEDTEIFQGDPYSVCEECYDSLYLQTCNMCNIPTDVHEMYIDEDLGTTDILICEDCIDNYGK
jgi:hypothetical protein